MANTKEIKRKIKSVNDIGTITKAMELVATSKVKFYRDQMFANRSYAEGLLHLIRRFVFRNVAHESTARCGRLFFGDKRGIKKVLYIVFSTDRGLCSALNSNLFKLIEAHRKKTYADDVETIFLPIGEKASNRYKKEHILPKVNISSRPTLEDFVDKSDKIIKSFLDAEIDEVHLCYNKYINSMLQEPKIIDLLPVSASHIEDSSAVGDKKAEFNFESDENTLLLALGKRYLEFIFFQANMENLACEQVARIMAMQSANENVVSMIGELNTTYHKARQAVITQEIAEIVAGASID